MIEWKIRLRDKLGKWRIYKAAANDPEVLVDKYIKVGIDNGYFYESDELIIGIMPSKKGNKIEIFTVITAQSLVDAGLRLFLMTWTAPQSGFCFTH